MVYSGGAADMGWTLSVSSIETLGITALSSKSILKLMVLDRK